MRIGIDISQIVYTGTGVGQYVRRLVSALVTLDRENEYVLFASTLRQKTKIYTYFHELKKLNPKVKLAYYPFPPTLLDFVWNKLHIIPIEWLTGPVDIFWSSDWTQPPLAGAKGITTVHDLSFIFYPQEAHNKSELTSGINISPNIVSTQLSRLKRALDECRLFICDSRATAKDLQEIFKLPAAKIKVIYPGF